MFSIPKFLFSLLFALVISVSVPAFSIPAFASDDPPNVFGCVGDCPKPEAVAVERTVERTIRAKCFTLTFPGFPGAEVEIYVEKSGSTVIYGEMTGDICSGLWIIYAGTLTRDYMLLYAYCAGGDCSGCYSSVVFEGDRVSRKCYMGTYNADDGAEIGDFDACKHRCR